MSDIADSLRTLADALDDNPRLAEIFTRAQFGTHLFGDDARLFSAFSDEFGAIRQQNDNRSYLVSEGTVGTLKVWCQTYEDDLNTSKEAS